MKFNGSFISDFYDDETEEDSKRVDELLNKLKQLEKEKSIEMDTNQEHNI